MSGTDMSLQVVGAGLGRTGTASLKIALEDLLVGRCHHMFEVHQNPEEVPVWTAAANGDMPDWQRFLSDYVALVDWPGASFWPELVEAFPEALVLLSVRDLDEWYDSADRLLVWSPGDGWEPICGALGLPVPDRPFPRTNTREEFIERQDSRRRP